MAVRLRRQPRQTPPEPPTPQVPATTPCATKCRTKPSEAPPHGMTRHKDVIFRVYPFFTIGYENNNDGAASNARIQREKGLVKAGAKIQNKVIK